MKRIVLLSLCLTISLHAKIEFPSESVLIIGETIKRSVATAVTFAVIAELACPQIAEEFAQADFTGSDLYKKNAPDATKHPLLANTIWGVWNGTVIGALCGVSLALAAQAGSKPKLSYNDLFYSMNLLTAGIAATGAATGVISGLRAYHKEKKYIVSFSSQAERNASRSYIAIGKSANAMMTCMSLNFIAIVARTLYNR